MSGTKTLDARVAALQQQLDKMRIITEKAQGTCRTNFCKERDFHRMHHRRVVAGEGESDY